MVLAHNRGSSLLGRSSPHPRAGFVLGIADAELGADEWAQRAWSWHLGLRSPLSDLTILFFPPKNSPPPPPTFTIEAIILTSFWYLSF